jgi:hypothetical protein
MAPEEFLSSTLQSQPELILAVSEAHYRAIGHVAMQWAYIERHINKEISWLRMRKPNKQVAINFQARFSKRNAAWVKLAKQVYLKHPEEMTAVHRISGRVVAIKKERDDLAHGTIGESNGKYTFFKFKEGRLVEISDHFGDPEIIEDLACRISKIGADLQRHQTRLDRRFPSRG